MRFFLLVLNVFSIVSFVAAAVLQQAVFDRRPASNGGKGRVMEEREGNEGRGKRREGRGGSGGDGRAYF